MMMKRLPRRLLIAATAWPAVAEAHLVSTRLGDFYGGAIHPLTGFEYVLPWLAFAILAALQGAPRARWSFVVFPLGLLAGAGLSLWLPHLGFAPTVNLAAIVAIGLLSAFAVALPLPAFLTLGAALALADGYDNAQAMAFDTDRVLFIAGLTAVGYVFIALAEGGAFAFLAGRGGWRVVALRAGGSWIAAVGVMVLGLQLAAG